MKRHKPILSRLAVDHTGRLVMNRFNESYPINSVIKKGSSTDFVLSNRKPVSKQ